MKREQGYGRFAQSVLVEQLGGSRVEQFFQRTVVFEELFGQRLHIVARDREGQHQLDRFVILQAFESGAQETFAQPFPVAAVRIFRGG